MSVSYDVVIVGVVCGVVTASVVVVLIWMYCNRKRKRQSSYEQILPDGKQNMHIENGTLVVNMKQIPFTVPTQATLTRRMERGSSEEFRPQSGGLSEPTSPLNVKRPSVEIPGAYALGSIDPSLYKIVDEDDDYEIPLDHIGRVWFAVEYERETEKLLVTLMKAKNLPTRQYGNNSSCDPFIRLYLMPDERRYLQSKFKKKTCNPKFEESFVFQVSYRSLQDRVLKITVYDVDRHRRHNVIGHALYPLKDHGAESNERLVIWRDLEREVTESTADKGELLVALCYNNHLERLTVGVLEARDLNKIQYPVSGALSGAGFFLLLFIEHLIGACQGSSHHFTMENTEIVVNDVELTKVITSDDKHKSQTDESKMDSDKHTQAEKKLDQMVEREKTIAKEEHTLSKLRAFVLLLAFSFHMVFEGLALGLEHTESGVWSLLGILALHKCVVAFSVGLQLSENLHTFKSVIASLAAFSAVAPVGVVLGFLVTEYGDNEHAQVIAAGVLQSLATGTFFYVTFFEILQKELTHGHNLYNVLSTVVGFSVVVGVEFLHDSE